jgi:hypothetical protein
MVKGNDDGGWSFDSVVLWLVRRQNGDAVEWWGEWPRLRYPFYSEGGSRADSMLQFWLERGGDGTKHCQKM